MSTIERYERTPRAELLDNAKESAPQPPPSSKAVVKVDLTAVAKRTSRIVQETTEAINDAFELHSTQHKKPMSFEDYLAFYKMQRDNGASWGTMFGNIRNKAKIGRAELAKRVGHRWTPATIRLLEDNKLSGLPEDELVCLAVALGAPEKALVALIESGWIPRLTTSTVPSTPAEPSTEPVEGVPAQDSTPEPTSAVPPTIQEVSMPYPKKKPGKEKVHKGGWFCPPGAALKKLRTEAGKTEEEAAETMGITVEKLRNVESGSIKLTVVQYSRLKTLCGVPPTPYQLLKAQKARTAALGVQKPQEASPSVGGTATGALPRKALLERATQLLGSSRITDAEANALLTGLEQQFLDTLLKL